jgi:hypothetical protein
LPRQIDRGERNESLVFAQHAHKITEIPQSLFETKAIITYRNKIYTKASVGNTHKPCFVFDKGVSADLTERKDITIFKTNKLMKK